ncbi:MAG TPA: hypothetical protein VJS92_12910 [Candidatus Polarisedimenticolaceae bacterium]|nr:hypothetical protein [Candidatus Polarisedimenticolaceae bacterium]
MSRTRSRVSLGWLLLWGAATAAQADTLAPFCKNPSITIGDGETHVGDLYFVSRNATVSGTQQGDLIGLGQAVIVNGEVTGDLVFLGQSVDIRGRVGDSVRVWGNTVTVSGTVSGDLLAFGNAVNILRGAHITGALRGFSGSLILDGTVDGDLDFVGGEAIISGSLGGNAKIKADTVQLDPAARIHGDLTYTARKEVELASPEIVGGHVQFTDKEREEADKRAKKESEPWLTFGGFAWWAWWTAGATLVGFLVLALFRRGLEATLVPLGNETMLDGLIGLGASVLIPVTAGLAMLLVIPIPASLLTLVLFLAVIYLAKLPVALWIGRKLLGLVGLSGASPYLAMACGMIVIYLARGIPFYIGWLVLFVTTWLGLGSMVLAVWARMQRTSSTAV